jgi:NADH dehydrogenase [ubiquinone] 1 alpha subcomplex assembly factor 7
MSAQVRNAIADAILDHGPISFAEFMELALYGPDGYYERPPIGSEGDFVTSPHVHPVFGELLAAAIRELHTALGRPTPLRLQEVGGGDGTLAHELMDALDDLSFDYVVVERSAGARQALSAIEGLRVRTDLEAGAHVVLAHELLDNLPFRRVRATGDGPREVRIALGADDLPIEVLTEAGEELRTVAGGLAPGEEAVVPDGALAFVSELGAALEHGYALVIDYGSVGSAGGRPHGYRDHLEVGDLLHDPGEADITAGVDFALVAEHARRNGLVAFPSVTQREALVALGFDRWSRGERRRQVELLDRREGRSAVNAWSGRSRASLLVDPTALGRHRWLLLASPGLEAPTWSRAPAPGTAR